MPLRNRVTPLGDLIATAERGLVYANRGCLHDAGGEIRLTSEPGQGTSLTVLLPAASASPSHAMAR